MKSLYTGLLLLLATGMAWAQKPLTDSRTGSKYLYVYRLNDASVKLFYTGDERNINQRLMGRPVDSVAAGHYKDWHLSPGNYAEVSANGNQLHYELIEQRSAYLKLLDDKRELRFILLDTNNHEISNADVQVRGSRIAYDAALRLYHTPRHKKDTLLRVVYQGVSNFYKIMPNDERSYVYKPPGWFKTLWSRVKYKLRVLFGKKVNPRYRSPQPNPGYMVFNKPKYRPGDTVKLKAFLLNSGYKVDAIRDARLMVRLKYNYNDAGKILGYVQAYRAGGFEYSFKLVDSLKLTLDRSYTISLETADNPYDPQKQHDEYVKHIKVFQQGTFQYEDYELTSSKFTLRADKTEHAPGVPASLYFRATDDNGLDIPDGRVEVTLRTSSASQFTGNHVFVPDTLWHHTMKLDPVGETKLSIPDSIFPKARIGYMATAVLLTSNNERRQEYVNLTYNNDNFRLDRKLATDTLKLDNSYKGRSQPVKAMLYRLNDDNDTISRSNISLPTIFRVDPVVAKYIIKTDSLDEDIKMEDFVAPLETSVETVKDSILVKVKNPAQMQFWYTVFSGDKMVDKGTGTSLTYKKAFEKHKTTTVLFNYIWAGKMLSDEAKATFQDAALVMDVTQPSAVYPGQQADIKVHVDDAWGKPVPNADLTAYALTAKFEGYNPPRVPYLGRGAAGRVPGIPLQINQLQTSGNIKLNWQRWSKQMGLDSIVYYRFTHPGQIYSIAEPTPDSTTQIAPFVMKDGDIIPVHILYVDGIPVYFSKTQDVQRYSFMVKPGTHDLRFRTAVQNIVLNNVEVKAATKLILSLNADTLLNKKAEFKTMPDTLTTYEANLMNQYLVSIVPNFGEHFATISRNGKIFLLNGSSYRAGNTLLVGPIADNTLEFDVKGMEPRYFDTEPNYSFQFEPGLIKQKSLPTKYPFTKDLLKQQADINYKQYAYTQKGVDTLWQNYLDQRARTINMFANYSVYSTTPGALSIGIGKLQNGKEPFIKSIIIYKNDEPDYARIYAGNTTELGSFAPGKYRILYLLKDNTYFLQEHIIVKPYGRNYYNTGIIIPHAQDKTSFKIAAIIDGHERYGYNADDTQRIKEVFNAQYLDVASLTGEMSGYIYAKDDKLPLPGVTVKVRGLQTGTQTDRNGFFRLKVPGSGRLVISFIGFMVEDVPIRQGQSIKLFMNAQTRMLSEVVVTAGGLTATKGSMGYSVSTIRMDTVEYRASDYKIRDALSGKLAGLEISDKMGSTVRIVLRGNRSVTNGVKPLIVVDGVIFPGDLSIIDPMMIGDIKVLNGTEAARMYGSDAANGAIIITTKNKNRAGLTMQAQSVTRVRLNGKDYVGANADMIMKNLPADVIENIQMVDDYGDQASVTGIKSGDPQRVLNVTGKILSITVKKDFIMGMDDPALLAMQSIRKNFSDYAYWQPKLTTDAQGNASFKATFPDDITNWKTFVIGITGNRQSGITGGQIRSYKPLSANFTAPLFAVKGDVFAPLGKVLNYTADTVQLKRTFKYNGELFSEKDLTVKNAVIDTFNLTAKGQDSLSFEYTVKKSNGYFDGEKLTIPLFEQGTLETKGTFAALDKDSTFTIKLDPKLQEGTFRAEASLLPSLLDEAQHLRDYEYLCNEQLASKLKGLLSEKKIRGYLGEPFKYDKNILEIIKKLQENRRMQGTWGWWKDTDEELWISLHAAEALLAAEAQGFKTELDKQKLIDYLLYQATAYRGEDKMTVMLLLRELGAKADYEGFIKEYTKQLDAKHKPAHYDQLRLMLVKQQAGITFERDSLDKWMRHTMFGNVHWGDESYNLFSNAIQESILAYHILKTEGKHPELLAKLRNYFLEQRKDGYWRNTYESALILETILPDLLIEGKKPEPSVITLSGGKNETITKFPYQTSLAGGVDLTVKKTGTMPVYVTAYQKFWNPAPEKVSKDFTVNTRFQKSGNTLTKATGGEPIVLEAEVIARADADMVMVEIPIPAGCSYLDKNQAYSNGEVHREYFKNKVSIFCRKLTQGKHLFTVSLTPRYGGTYQLNPAKAEMMYFPVFYGREGMKVFKIE